MNTPDIVCYCTGIAIKMHRSQIDSNTIWVCPRCKRKEILKPAQTFACGRNHYYVSDNQRTGETK